MRSTFLLALVLHATKAAPTSRHPYSPTASEQSIESNKDMFGSSPISTLCTNGHSCGNWTTLPMLLDSFNKNHIVHQAREYLINYQLDALERAVYDYQQRNESIDSLKYLAHTFVHTFAGPQLTRVIRRVADKKDVFTLVLIRESMDVEEFQSALQYNIQKAYIHERPNDVYFFQEVGQFKIKRTRINNKGSVSRFLSAIRIDDSKAYLKRLDLAGLERVSDELDKLLFTTCLNTQNDDVGRIRVMFIEKMLQHGADVQKGAEAVFEATTIRNRWNPDLVRLLLEYGADFDMEEGKLLRMAAGTGKTAVLMALLENGARVDWRDDEALRWAASNAYDSAVEALLENGANVHAMNDYALRDAAAEGLTSTVRLLLSYGADPTANDCEALKTARKGNHFGVLALLGEWARGNGSLMECLGVRIGTE